MNQIIKQLSLQELANECEIETSELEPFPGLRANITGVRPIVDATATVTVKTKERSS